MSERESTSPPSNCSGDMYCSVPRIVPSCVSGRSGGLGLEHADTGLVRHSHVDGFCQSEVEQLYARVGQHDVAGL